MDGVTKSNVVLTKEQEQCVNFSGGDLIVKGIAGAGKSVVLLERALKFNYNALKEGLKIKIAIFTFANTLVHYTSELIEHNKMEENMIEVSTIDKYCYNLYVKMNNGRRPYFIDDKTKKELVEQAIQNHFQKTSQNHRFYKLEDDFWVAEFQWIKEKRLNTLEKYSMCSREGRGGKVRMSQKDKQVAYELYMEYNRLLKEKKRMEWEDVYTYILDNKQVIPDSFYLDYVLIDEAQDLSFVKLCVAKHLAKKSVTIAADQAQKIYNTSFTWKEIGINVSGKSSKTLNKSFRSTKQIIALADSLIAHNKKLFEQKDEYVKSVLPEKDGGMPVLISCQNEEQEKMHLCRVIKGLLEKDSKRTIGILYRTRIEGAKIKSWLRKDNIPYEEIQSKGEWSLLAPGVKLITMHSAKGLEVDTVIIPKMCEGILPMLPREYDDEQLDDLLEIERSVLYVGMTRARDSLILLYSGVKSRFLNEMNNKLLEER